MKKVLVITYYWPPGGGAGVQRWLKFVKYLRESGWEPVVYTPSNPEHPVNDESLLKDIPANLEVLRTPIWEPYDAYKKLTGRKKDDRLGAGMLSEKKKGGFAESLSMWVRGNFFIPDARKFWIKPSVKYLAEYLAKNPVDALVSTGPPHSMHLIALGLKERFPQLRWIADFRDPWTNIDFYHELKLSAWADRKHHRLERAVLDRADVVVSVGETMSEELRALASPGKQDAARFRVITNGYDEEDVYKGPLEKDARFSLAHIGTLGKARNPGALWEALQELIAEHKDLAADLEIKFVGKVDASVLHALEQHKLSSYVNKIDYLRHTEATRVQQESHALLLLVNNTPNAKGILTGKFFEYMASGTPVLAIGPPDGDLAKIIHETQSGLIADFNDVAALKRHVLHLYGIYKQKGVSAKGKNIEKYSRRELTKEMAKLLEK